MDDLLRALLFLQGFNTVALLGIAFAAGKYAQSVTMLEREVGTLRESRHEFSQLLTELRSDVKAVATQIGHRRLED